MSPDQDTFKFGIVIPYFGGADLEHLDCVRALTDLGVPLMTVRNHPYIDHARAVLASRTLREMHIQREGQADQWDTLFWIDHDIMGFTPDDVFGLVETCRKTGCVVSGAYPMKKPGGNMVGAFHPEVIEKGAVRFFEGGELQSAIGVGMGFCATPMKVLRDVSLTLPSLRCSDTVVWPFFHHLLTEEPKPPIETYDEPTDGAYMGEDYSFCRRVIEAGHEILIDTRIRIEHKGAYKYRLEDMGIVVPHCEFLNVSYQEGNPPPSNAEYEVAQTGSGPQAPGSGLSQALPPNLPGL